MTTEEAVRQMLVVGFDGPVAPPALLAEVARWGLGGIILFRRNVDTPQQIVLLCSRFQQAALSSPGGLPLLIAIDQEGGRVARLSAPFTRFPPAARLGGKKTPLLCRDVGRVMARELRAAGVNMNCAPVLDVEDDPNNPVLGDRVYGGDPDLVAEMGAQFIRGLQGEGVMAVGKHFPGHRGIAIDPHRDLPTSPLGLENLSAVDFRPFRRAIAENVAAIMTAHVLYPEIDPDRPATLSPRFFDGFLRRDLGFPGLIVSDDLDMGAIARHRPLERAAVEAVGAGSDLLLLCRDAEKVEMISRAFLRALDQGEISEGRLQASVRRIVAAKEKFLIPCPEPDGERLSEILSCPEHAEVARRAWS